VPNAFSLFHADINICDSSLGFVNNAAVQMSLIYTASHCLCNLYMYIRTHARCHNMWCVCVCFQILCTNTQYHEIYARSEPSTSLAPTSSFHMLQKAHYFIVAGVWIGCYKKKVWVEIPVAKWSFLVLLCCVLTVRVVGLIGVQLWGHYEATKWAASNQTRPLSVALIPSSVAVKVFAQHISVNVLYA
jgi:hypothetical protein